MGKYNNRPFSYSRYIEFESGSPLFLNDDAPEEAYRTSEMSFVAQPADEELNKKHNVIPVPLMMTDEYEILQKNPDLIEKLRNTEKTFDYNFVGQCHYVGREVFRDLDLESYDFEENPKGVYGLPKDQKHVSLISFLYRIAKCKFVFCPRGVGSSSFRLYQSLMVGSIPIVTGMNDYPFKDEVDWDSFCIRGKLSDLPALIEKSRSVDVEKMRENGMKFWDEYCEYENLYSKLHEIYKDSLCTT